MSEGLVELVENSLKHFEGKRPGARVVRDNYFLDIDALCILVVKVSHDSYGSAIAVWCLSARYVVWSAQISYCLRFFLKKKF